MVISRILAAILGAGGCAALALRSHALPPRYDHVVIVVEENHSDAGIIGNADAPYLNSIAASGASFSNLHALTHPSQPNYLSLFSGSNQGTITDLIPLNPQGIPTTTDPFITPNLAAALRQSGYSFAGYSQSLPAAGSQDATVGDYARRHAPWINWQNNAWADDAHPPAAPLSNTLPASVNLPFTAFPPSSNYAALPTVSFVIPDLKNDMHTGTVAEADDWLKANIDPYYQWAKTHNSLLIVTWDEDDKSTSGNNTIPTLFAGARIKPGAVVPQTYTLDNVLRTVEDIYALPYAGNSAAVKPIVGAFTTDPAVTRITFRQGANSYSGAKDTQIREAAPTTAYATMNTLAVDGDDDDVAAGKQHAHTLIRFDNIIAGAGGTIPTDATILSAKLTLYTTNATADPVELHRMIASWSDTATWNSVGGGVAPDGVHAAVASDFTTAPPLINGTVHFDVTDTLQQWVDGKALNNGWVILPNGTDGFGLVSSEGATVAQRPTLDVSYALYPRFAATGGSWNAVGNWANGTPNASGAVARFLSKPAAAAITLDGNKSVGLLLIDNSASYTLNAGSGGTLTFANNGNIAMLQVKQGQHTLAVPLNFTDPGGFDIADGAAVNATAGVTVAGGKSLVKSSAGLVQITGGLALGINSTVDIAAGEFRADRISGAGALAIRAGATARLTAGNSTVSTITALSLDGKIGAWDSTLDIGRSALVINYSGASPLSTISDQIKSARSEHWIGGGIGSTAAYSDRSTSIAVAEASNLLGISGAKTVQFMGETVDSTSLLIRFTKTGDATLDGRVDFSDLVRIAQNYGSTPADGAWSDGDFNYDGRIDFSDLVAIAQNYGGALPADSLPDASVDFSADVAIAFGSVPEPSVVLILGVSLLASDSIGRRRARRQCGPIQFT